LPPVERIKWFSFLIIVGVDEVFAHLGGEVVVDDGDYDDSNDDSSRSFDFLFCI